jgi:exopolyphosphatase / guanosine-5'-triphosphate,3'-diphosphate pyrophosphatase
VTSPPVVVGIIDIGSNTARLLVASVSGEGVGELQRDRRYLRLGDDVHALGRIGARKVKEAARVAKAFARIARKEGAREVETIVTAPGRQASNGVELVAALAASTGASVVQLSGLDEGRLAWHGAVARASNLPETIAVVDLGGGSCELAVGGSELGPTWVRSVDAGALRITREYLGSSRPGPREVLRARDGIRRLVQELDASSGVTHERAQTLLGGTLVLAELAHRLDSTLEVGQGGLREGAALTLAQSVETAA